MQVQYPDWWIHGGGSPYPAGVQPFLNNTLDPVANQALSVLIIRETQHHLNLSGGKETFVPSRLLYGLVPQAILDSYLFWQDESNAPRHVNPAAVGDISFGGYKRLRGYPIDKDGEHIIFVELLDVGSWDMYTGAGLSNECDPYVMECTGT